MASTTEAPASRPAIPSRRYRRISAERWEQQQPRIKELFLEEQQTLKAVIRVLKEEHDFDVSIRQLKRKLHEWRITKNVLANKRLRTPRPPLRSRQSDGSFQTVQSQRSEPLEAQTPLDDMRGSTLSDSSHSGEGCGLPSNMTCEMPHGIPSSTTLHASSTYSEPEGQEWAFLEPVEPVSLDYDQINLTAEPPFVSKIFIDGGNNMFEQPEQFSMETGMPLFPSSYDVTRQMYTGITQMLRRPLDANHWASLTLQHQAAVMEAPQSSSQPHSINALPFDMPAQTLAHEKVDLSLVASGSDNIIEMHNVPSTPAIDSTWYPALMPQQQDLKHWEGILDPRHATTQVSQGTVDAMRNQPGARHNTNSSFVQRQEEIYVELNDLPQFYTINKLLRIDEQPSDQLVEHFRILEISLISGCQDEQAVQVIPLGRSRALIGLCCSFLKHFREAEEAFQDSLACMQHESNTEIKLHNLLWIAEHKTRLHNARAASQLLSQAQDLHTHEVSGHSRSVDLYFRGRFDLLQQALSLGESIDKVIEGPLMQELVNSWASYPGIGANLTDDHTVLPPSIAWDNTATPTRLFAPSHNALYGKISVDTWRQLIEM